MTPSKIVKLKLEQRTLRHRDEGLSQRAIAAKLTEDCGVEISHKNVASYLTAVDQETVAVVHRPKHAEANAELSIDVAQRLRDAMVRLDAWRDEAEAIGEGGPNWPARLGVIREAREHTRLYADLLDRVYNVEQVAAFQRAVMRVLGGLEPALKRKVQEELAKETELVRASLLGAGR